MIHHTWEAMHIQYSTLYGPKEMAAIWWKTYQNVILRKVYTFISISQKGPIYDKHGGLFKISRNYWSLLIYYAFLNTVDHMCRCAKDFTNP